MLASALKTTFALQTIVLVIAAAILGIFNAELIASYVYGALVFAVANAYFTLYAFRRSARPGAGDVYNEGVVRSFIWGEYGKLVLVGLGFGLTFTFQPETHVPAFLLGFASLVVCQWWIADRIAKLCDTHANGN